jgi:hypothetical protein
MQPLPFLNPLIYPLLGSPCFRDITVGSNGVNHKYDAKPGYDLVSGLGVPNVRALMRVLATPSAGVPGPLAVKRDAVGASGSAAPTPPPASSNRITPLLFSTKNAYGVEDDIRRIRTIFSSAEDALSKTNPDIKFQRPIIGKGIRDKEELFQLIRAATVDQSTTLFCYCKLHGKIETNGEHVLELDGIGATVTRKELLRELRRLGAARLTILITDSCAHVPVLPAQAGVLAVVFPRELFLDLFVHSEGLVVINSASIGQRAWMDLDGALFTRVFAQMLSASPQVLVEKLYRRIDKNENGRYSWSEVLPVLTSDTEALFQTTKGGIPLDMMPVELKTQSKQTPAPFSDIPTKP